MRLALSWHYHQHLLLSVFLFIVILVAVKWNLITVWICIYLMANGVKHFFMCLLANSVFSLEKYLFRSCVFLLLRCNNSLYILNTSPLSYMICKSFLLFCVLSFNFLMMSFEAQKFLILMKSNLSIFSLLLIVLLVSYLRTHCLTWSHEGLHLWFLLTVLGLRSYFYVFDSFWLDFYIWCEVEVQLHSFACRNPIVPAPFVEKT